MMERLKRHLDQFKDLSSPGPYEYDWVFHHDGGQYRKHIVFGIMVHGNEFGSLPGALKVIGALHRGELKFGGQVTFFVGNPEAGLANQRFLEADLNRVFLAMDDDTHEVRRAQKLMPILDDCDVFIDFHQTILETKQPFYIFPWNPTGWHWARTLGAARVWVTRHPGQAFSTGTRCADEYVRLQEKPGLTIELSEKGFNPQADAITTQAIVDALNTINRIQSGEANLEAFATKNPDLDFYHTVHREKFTTPDLQLRDGLVNFLGVQPGESLSATGRPSLIAPQGGMLLFPKYPPRTEGLATHPIPKEIYRIIEQLPEHPAKLYSE